MNNRPGLVVSALRSTAMILVALFLILVLFPAALAAQSAHTT